MMVKKELKKLGLHPTVIDLGIIELFEDITPKSSLYVDVIQFVVSFL